MAEAVTEGCPQVFVVDSQASSMPSGKHLKRGGIGRRLQTILVGLALFGVIVEACFIFYLYNKTVNLPSTTASHQPSGNIMGQVGSEETKATPPDPTRTRTTEIQWKPSAHLIYSEHPVDKNGVVQWIHNMSDAFQHHMSYSDSRLWIEIEGYYYLYSKVQLNSDENCSTFKHMVMRETNAYAGKPLELMKDFRLPCESYRGASMKNQRAPGGDHRLSSFLGGVFQLHSGDAIYVKLEAGETMSLGTTSTDTFMGAFMI